VSLNTRAVALIQPNRVIGLEVKLLFGGRGSLCAYASCLDYPPNRCVEEVAASSQALGKTGIHSNSENVCICKVLPCQGAVIQAYTASPQLNTVNSFR
jgi:hypothetical protein